LRLFLGGILGLFWGYFRGITSYAVYYDALGYEKSGEIIWDRYLEDCQEINGIDIIFGKYQSLLTRF